MDNNSLDGVRLHVFLAKCGVGSRRTCETYIAEKRVTVNGLPVTTPGTRFHRGDAVCFDGKAVHPVETRHYIMLHKPPGYLCSNSDPHSRPLAIDLLGDTISTRLFHVGRLDMYSSGLLLFTNDGEFTRIITHPSSEIEKEYIVQTRDAIKKDDLFRFRSGVEVEGERYRIKKFTLLEEEVASIVLTEGKNREIRTVFAFFGYTIRKLHRLRIGEIALGMLKPGNYRNLETWEIETILSRGKRSI